METSLHRQLKDHYSQPNAAQEATLGRFRIDVINADGLVEIQHGSLAAIGRKVATLLKDHSVTVVKPVIARKRILRLPSRGGTVISQRWSPKRGTLLDLFDDLVHFTRVFPHANLTLEVPLVEVEELRFPGHGRRRWRRDSDHQVEDLRLIEIGEVYRFRQASDLRRTLPIRLPQPFHTGQLATKLGVTPRVAQRIVYCLRETGCAVPVGKTGNTRLYRWPAAA